MTDTHPDIEERFFRMIMEKSGEERLRMGLAMNQTVRRLVIASLLNQNREASEKDIKSAIFERFYGNDLSSEIKEIFIKRIKAI